MYLEEAAIASASSLIVFGAFSIHAAMRLWPAGRFPVFLKQLLTSSNQVDERPLRWGAVVASGVFAAVGQLPVIVVILYRGSDLGVVARLLLAGELLASIGWLALIRRWVRAAPQG